MAVHRFIAVVILVAVAITFTAIGASWIITTMHSVMWKPEILKILDLEIEQQNNAWVLRIEAENIGEARAEIYKVEVVNIEELSLSTPLVIEPGHIRSISFKLTKSYKYGALYTIRLYLRSGTVYNYLEYRVAPK
jgi:hypothetical protein